MDELQALKDAINDKRAVLVVGSGVSAATSDGARTATWGGLVEHAIDYVEAHSSESSAWARLVRQQLAVATDGSDPDQLEQAANQVGLKLSKLGEQAYANWLDEAVGELPLVDEATIAPLVRIDAPILTTNYDDLLERQSGRPGTDWTNDREIQRAVVSGTSIAHIHGSFKNPPSVVLTTTDYTRQQAAPAVQALQKAVSATKSLIYVGCGGTLEDPNFSRLLSWHRSTFITSEVKHYRLCRTGELESLQRRHADDNIIPIAFGPNHQDLALFLEELAPSDDIADIIIRARDYSANVRELILNDLADDNLLLKDRGEEPNLTIDSATSPPILLTTPPGTVPSEDGEDESPVRADPRSEAESARVMLVVAEEGAGLTTALRWLLYTRSSAFPSEIPALIEPRSLPKGNNPLRKYLQQHQYAMGAITGLRDSPVPAVIAVDNFPTSKTLAARILQDLIAFPNRAMAIIGCQSVNEAATLEMLRAAGIEPEIRFLGKISSRDVQTMASQVAPGRAKEIADLVVRTIRREHLPRTPFNASILISILLRGEQLALASSPSLILDQYVAHLLGRDEVSADSRTGLSAADRDVLLWELAIRFIEGDEGSISEVAAVETLAEAIERYGWDENPSEVIEDLASRKVLRRNASNIRFAQSAYLHLFAAKAAARRNHTKARLLERPLYYAAVLRSYAGLIRHDERVLERVSQLLDEAVDQPSISVFDEIELIEAPAEFPSSEEESVSEEEQIGDETGESAVVDILESFDDTDVTPFPSKQDDELTGLPRRAQSLNLVSTVLRDSEEVENLDLKASVLHKVLRGWSQLTDAMLHDPGFVELTEKIRTEATQSESEEPELDEQDLDRLIRTIPAVIAYTGLASSLASRKLLQILKRANTGNAVQVEVEASLGAAMLLHATDQSEWAGMAPYVRPWMQRGFTQDFIFPLLFVSFVESKPGSKDEKVIRELCGDVAAASRRFNSEGHRRLYRDALFKELDGNKRKLRRQLGIDV